MAHEHNQDHKNLKLIFFLNLGFAILELLGGLLANSYAIISDSIHDLGDALIILVAIVCNKVGSRSSSENFPLGYGKVKVIGSLLTSTLLIISSLFIFKGALTRLNNPQEVHTLIMIILAFIAIIVNSIALIKLKSSNSKLNFVIMLHMLEDLLGWIAVLVGAIVIHFTNFYIIDPLLSILISIVILGGATKNIISCIKSLLLTTPKEVNIDVLYLDLSRHYDIDPPDLKIIELDDHKFLLLLKYKKIYDTPNLAQIIKKHNITQYYIMQKSS